MLIPFQNYKIMNNDLKLNNMVLRTNIKITSNTYQPYINYLLSFQFFSKNLISALYLIILKNEMYSKKFDQVIYHAT